MVFLITTINKKHTKTLYIPAAKPDIIIGGPTFDC